MRYFNSPTYCFDVYLSGRRIRYINVLANSRQSAYSQAVRDLKADNVKFDKIVFTQKINL